MAGSLTPNQVTAYEQHGYLSPLDILSPDEATCHRAEIERIEATTDLPRSPSEYLRMNAHLTMDVSLNAARDSRVLDAVESVLGPDLLLWSCEYFVKEANSRQIVSWHQDLTYWGMNGSDHEVTAWLALSPATVRSGCMKFVPGSHKESLIPHNDTFAGDNLLSRGQEIAVDVDEEDAIHAELQPGQMSLHHGRMFHGSGPNMSDDRRIGFVMRFIRPDTPSVGKDYAMLMRGEDPVGNRINLVPAAGDFAPDRLAMYDRVQATVDSVLSDGLSGPEEMYKEEPAHV